MKFKGECSLMDYLDEGRKVREKVGNQNLGKTAEGVMKKGQGDKETRTQNSEKSTKQGAAVKRKAEKQQPKNDKRAKQEAEKESKIEQKRKNSEKKLKFNAARQQSMKLLNLSNKVSILTLSSNLLFRSI